MTWVQHIHMFSCLLEHVCICDNNSDIFFLVRVIGVEWVPRADSLLLARDKMKLGAENGFTYEEKGIPFGTQSNPKHSLIGKLLTKYERRRPVDMDEEKQIEKKKTVYHGNSLNYSQIYSDLQISRAEKVRPEGRTRGISHS